MKSRAGFNLLRSILITLLVFTVLSSVLGQFGSVWWGFDLAALFYDRYAVTALILMLAFILLRSPRWAVLAAVTLAFNTFFLLPYLPIKGLSSNDLPDLKVMNYNILYANPDPQTILDEIELNNPDVVFLMEYPTAFQDLIESNLIDYPYRLIEPSRRTIGLALFSKLPLEETHVHRFSDTRIPIFEVELSVKGQTISFVGGHPWPPIGRWGQFHQNQMLDIIEVASNATHPLIVAGDFNASQWSFITQKLAKDAAVKDARRGFGLRHTFRVAPLLSIPLEHVFVSRDWKVNSYKTGKKRSSDHNSIVLGLSLLN